MAVEAAEQQSSDGDVPEEVRLREKLSGIVGRLEKEAEDRVGKRQQIEQRWLEDLRQYHGRYEDKEAQDLTDQKRSKLFVNQTRPKTNACEARLSDMLFPTDDRNWGIKPTPVPELTVEAERAAQEAAGAKQQAADNPESLEAQNNAQDAEHKSRKVQAEIDEARKRSESMQEEIDDHLRQCQYSAQARDCIHDACVLGTGIMKGPIAGHARRTWAQQDDGTYKLDQVEAPQPAFWRVDPWALFPDFDARTPDECESWFERHLMNPKELRKLAKQPGFDPDAIRRLLREQSRSSTPTYLADVRSITGSYHDATTDRYHVWEYHGPLSADELLTLAAAAGKDDMVGDLGLDAEDVDPLMELDVIIWFCQGEVLKFGIHHLDSGEPIYSIYNLEKDDGSVFGFGIPYLMRHPQKALNAGWRAMMDNAGLSTGPQTIINEEVIEPVNGVWALEARKMWKRKQGAPAEAAAFESFDIPSQQQELANVIQLAKMNIDEETGIPMLAQGDQGSHVTDTAQGMSILMNSVNVVFRRIVKNWDDDMTTPNIRRIYDWLMQFSDKDHIKGDYEVDARGTSVLLVREMQSQNLMAFLTNFGAHPTLAPFLKNGGLPALRQLVQTMMIPADELLKSDQEMAEEAAAAAEQDPQPDPEIMKIEADLNKTQMEWDGRMQVAQFERETQLMVLAEKHNMTLEQLRAKLEDTRQKTESDERKFAAETAVTQRRGPSGGGYY